VALGFYTNTNSVIIPTFSEVTVIATCDAGDVATGGGYECDLLNPIVTSTDPRFSAPEGENGWKAFWNSDNQPLSCTVSVKCADTAP